MSRAAQIYTDWDKIKRELEERERAVFCNENEYGYEIAVSNKVLNIVYEKCKSHFKILGAPSDKERKMWEKNVKVILYIAYKQMYKYDLVYPVKNTWQVAQLEECVRCINPDDMYTLLTVDGNPFKEEVIKNRMGKNRAAQRTAQCK